MRYIKNQRVYDVYNIIEPKKNATLLRGVLQLLLAWQMMIGWTGSECNWSPSSSGCAVNPLLVGLVLDFPLDVLAWVGSRWFGRRGLLNILLAYSLLTRTRDWANHYDQNEGGLVANVFQGTFMSIILNCGCVVLFVVLHVCATWILFGRLIVSNTFHYMK